MTSPTNPQGPAWAKVKELVDACMDLDPEGQSHYLDEACKEDPELRGEVESLLAADGQAGDFMEHSVLRESFVGLRLGPWKIVADIGEGGMSRVCLAERDDGQFEQRAAVKILKRGMDTDLILRHFQMERQILAGMRHPNVARLLDGGVTPSGRPYFVMEHIEGEPIDKYADAKKMDPAARLRLFQQVCAAVHYAHQRLVVHRDIKPSNILVTSDGTAKLLDFGIATILSTEPALGTLTSAQMLTPDYASPEQIRGEPVTTSSDVYSLGVLLYRMSSGRNPYGRKATPHELVRAICEQEPAAPSTVAAQERRHVLTGDLDNIILKALEKDPQTRYSSAEQFSQDIENYLEGRPVLARPHTWTYRASKFVKRNKFAVAAGAVVALLIAGGVATTLWQARIAGIERGRAEERFQETRQLANSMLFEVHDAIKDLPGSTAARALIIKRSLAYLDRISAASPGNSALQVELAEGYERLGDVQGRSGDANLGEYASARTSYQKAIALLKDRANDPVIDRKRRRLLALTQIRLGDYKEIERAVATLEALRQTAPQDKGALTDLAAGLGTMSNLLVERRDLPQGLAFRLKELALRKEILDADSRDTQAMRNYALASKRMGSLMWKLKRVPEAMAHYETALHLEEGWAEREPANADAKMAISYSHSDIGFFYWDDGKFKEALDHYRKAVKLREELAEADPNNARATLSLVSACWRTAGVYTTAGDTANALEFLNKASKVLRHAKKPDPASAPSRTEMAHVYAGYGKAYADAHQTSAARDWYGRSRQILIGLRASKELNASAEDLFRSVDATLAALAKVR